MIEIRDEVAGGRSRVNESSAETVRTDDDAVLTGTANDRHASEVRQLARENARLSSYIQKMEREREALQSLPGRRVGRLSRRIVDRIANTQRNKIRRVLKAVWWAVTPWRLPARLRFIRDRNAALTATASSQSFGSDETATFYKKWSQELAANCFGVSSGDATVAISFLVNAGRGSDDVTLGRTLASLSTQQQTAWQAIIFGADRPRREGKAFISLIKGDSKIAAIDQSEDLDDHPAMALVAAQGAFIAFLDAGDILAPGALGEIAAALSETPHVEILYCDEDSLEKTTESRKPYLKPKFSPDLLYSFNYFGRITLLRRAAALEVGGVDRNARAAFEWDLNLRVADVAQAVIRLPKVLCHRRPGEIGDRAAQDSQTAADARHVIESYWRRRGLEAAATTQRDGTQLVSWALSPEPKISIIMPTKDKSHLLRMSTNGILQLTNYCNIELIVVDTGSTEKETYLIYDQLSVDSRVKIVHYRSEFNYSSACNVGAQAATGKFLLFLNNDIEVVSRDWLADMVRFASRPGVGCVGVKLIFPSRELQHGGVSIGPHLAALAYRGQESMEFDIYGSPHHPRNWMAIMGACQMVAREAFDAVGGFDEAYRVAMSDVALCIQLWRAGYRTVYTPTGALVHHEGSTRGHTNPSEDLRRLADDIRRLGIDEDPYLHPGLDGNHATPKLREPGGDGPGEVLRKMIGEFGSFRLPSSYLDLTDDGDVLELVDRLRSQVLWSPQPASRVVDTLSAVRWTLDLLRRRDDLRARFPNALSEGKNGRFYQWLIAEGVGRFGLPAEAETALSSMFDADIGARARRFFYWRDEIRTLLPHGLTPAGGRELFRWFIQHGRLEGNLRLEEIWWLFWEAGEQPEREIVRALCLTPSWQAKFPDAASPLGADRFARWFAANYRVEGPWLDPARWPFPGTPAEQIRLAWWSREDWQHRHPEALRERTAARTFLAWLVAGEAAMEPWAAAWLRDLAPEATADAVSRLGVNLIAHFRYPSGLRISAEAIADGLHRVGVDVALRDIRTDANDDPEHERFIGFETNDVTIIHTQPEPFFRTVFERADLCERHPRSYRIAYWYWEFDTIPDGWRRQASEVDEVWAATEFVAKGLREKLRIPVHTLFPGVRLAPFKRRNRAYFGLSENETIYLFTFHMMSVMERKNPLGLIRAFRQAFKSEEPVRLVLKTSFGDRHPKQIETLRAAAEGSRITVIDEIYTPDNVLALMDVCDTYVSLHRSEGLGLTMAEAMLMGKPVVATGYSGNMDFMDSKNSLLVDFELRKLGEPIPPYEADFVWAEPDEAHAAELMRRLWDDSEFAAELGRKARIDAVERLSVEKAGRLIEMRLSEIRSLKSV